MLRDRQNPYSIEIMDTDTDRIVSSHNLEEIINDYNT